MKPYFYLALVCSFITLLSFNNINKGDSPDPPSLNLDTQAFFPLEIRNHASASGNNAKTMLLMTGKTLKTAVDCGLTFTFTNGAYFGHLVPLTANSTPNDFTIQLDTLQGYSNDSTVLFMIPQLQSGRALVSMNSPLCMHTNPDGSSFTFQDPSINNPSDPNYNLVYDKFEFTYDSLKTFFINPTAVDFFSIPIHMNTTDNSQHSGVPTNLTRSQMMTAIQSTLTKMDSTNTHSWDTCVIRDPQTNTLIRIASPSLAPGFDTTYLSNNKRGGFNYINNLIDYYRTKSLTVDCRPLNSEGFEIFDKYGKTPEEDPGAYYFTGTIGNSSPPVFTFVNSPKRSSGGGVMRHSIKMDSVTSGDFFKPGTGQFATPNKTLQSIIVQNIVSGFSVGLLPAMNGDTFSNKIFPKEIPSFFKHNPRNTKAADGKGPWYNLYSQAIHDALGNSIYSFAYDDVLGMDGTLATSNADTIRVTIQDLGNIRIPDAGCEPAVIPVALSSIVASKIKCNSTTCTMTVSWQVPSGQPRNANYFIMFGPGTFRVPAESIVSNQLQTGALPAFNIHETTICFDKATWLGRNSGTDIELSVFTCGGTNSPCPTSTDLSLWTKGLGVGPVKQTAVAIDPKGCAN